MGLLKVGIDMYHPRFGHQESGHSFHCPIFIMSTERDVTVKDGWTK